MLKATRICTFVQAALQCGIEVDEIFRGTTRDISILLAQDELLDYEEAHTILKNIAALTSKSFALAHGASLRHANMGVVGNAVLSCTSLSQVNNLWVNYAEVIGHPLSFSSIINNDDWALEFYPRFKMDDDVLQFCLEDAIASIFPLVAEVIGMPFRPDRIELTIGKPDNFDDYPNFIHAPVEFGCRRNSFVAPRSLLDLSVSSADRELYGLFAQHCSEVLKEIHRNATLTHRVLSILMARTGQMPEEESVAMRLGLSRRTFVRRLRAEGYSFRQLVQDYRRESAIKLLEQNILQVKEIAHFLGYKEVGSFRRSFKGWTGLSVTDWIRNRPGSVSENDTRH